MVNTSDEIRNLLDSQNRLEECCQRKKLGLPLYQLIEEVKNETRKLYTFQVTLSNNIVAEGIDISRRLAKSRAALNALEVLADNDAEVPPGYESQKSLSTETHNNGTNGDTTESKTSLQRCASEPSSSSDKNHLLAEEQSCANKPTLRINGIDEAAKETAQAIEPPTSEDQDSNE